jgi:TATA-box binding protein (TBP) (component of TFIID and TFIIIB)
MTSTTKTKTGDDLVFPDFDDIKVSTKTFTATTNLNIKIEQLYQKLPITPYEVVPKKRGRKKKTERPNPNKDITPGSIITAKYENEIRGVELKPKKPKPGKKNKWFRNSITVVIILDKPINFKVCRNGTFQMTGCKTQEHAELCVKYIWKYMEEHTDIYSFTRGKRLETLFIPSMRNIDFSLDFLVDREKLNRYMCTQREFHCLLETSFGYTGVNIKVPLTEDITTMKVKKISYIGNGDWEHIWTTYQEYLDLLTPKERDVKLNADRYNTFLVFHSGKVIMSGLTADFMREVYYYFLSIVRNAFDKIEERLLPLEHDEHDLNNLGELSLEEELALMEKDLKSTSLAELSLEDLAVDKFSQLV